MKLASLPEEKQKKREILFTWEDIEPEIKETWERLNQKVKEIMGGLDSKKVKLYRDSCYYLEDTPELKGRIADEYSEMKKDAEKGVLEPVFQYLLEVLPPENFVGPEDIPINGWSEELEEELEELKKKVAGENLTLVESMLKTLDKLEIRARDISMASTISRTLQEGETGLLFVGLAHEPQRFLARDIRYEVVFGREEWPGEYQR